ncbi:lanthionine synthetase LanC family protein [Solirubrobacter soli]|uniref:lanthionine synthetase LanC family protein n=1 Tax=Solirubrobacter soli TaxID=363832 RepID=UPI000412A8C8|nr:lanthionine synthetase LanC family protein [Solirubrobacter soli]
MSSDFLEAAAGIGRAITADAVWHDGGCSWMGAVVEPSDPSRPEYRPVGALVYDGTAGIGLFLAQLFTRTGDGDVRRTALGALRHALTRPGTGDGLFAGALGVAWAAREAGALLGEDELVAAGDEFTAAWAERELRAAAETAGDAGAAARRGAAAAAGAGGPRRVPARRCPDVVLGAAGALAALVAAGEVEAACVIGDGLLRDATVNRYGWAWRGASRRRDSFQCGAAHGAAGIAWALLELFAATGDERFADAARGAFAYERSWLDVTSGTWPDLRLPSRRGAHTPGMVGTWCYGEAGIALSRLRANELLGDGPHAQDARVATSTTHDHVCTRLPFSIDDLSLCHGMAGAADALIEAGDHTTAAALGEAALERFGGGDWPCGLLGTTPGLFRGTSGIGWLFLRLHDPSADSPLALPLQRR